MAAIYSGTIDNTDRAIARLLKKLSQVDSPENTLIVYSSDNGSYRADRVGHLRATIIGDMVTYSFDIMAGGIDPGDEVDVSAIQYNLACNGDGFVVPGCPSDGGAIRYAGDGSIVSDCGTFNTNGTFDLVFNSEVLSEANDFGGLGAVSAGWRDFNVPAYIGN